MAKEYEKKITWTIKTFSTLKYEEIYSDQFVVGGSKWRLRAYPKGCGDSTNKCLSLYLNVADSDSLPHGWKRHTKVRLTVVNQVNQIFERFGSKQIVEQHCFDQSSPTSGSQAMVPLTKLVDKNEGFMVNGEVKIVAEVAVLKVVGKSDVLEEISFVNESTDVNGFQVLPSQVESVKSLFEKLPDIALKLRLKNPHLRTAYLSCLLSLTESLCQSPEKLSNDDLANAYSTLTYLTKAGFKFDWLEKKLKEVGQTRVQQIEEGLKDMEGLLEFIR